MLLDGGGFGGYQYRLNLPCWQLCGWVQLHFERGSFVLAGGLLAMLGHAAGLGTGRALQCGEASSSSSWRRSGACSVRSGVRGRR